MLNIELRVLSGKQKGKAIPLKAGKFLIGRGEDCHLRPGNDLVSRHHCVFTVDDYGVRIRDLGSTNGTFINDEQLRGQAVLKEGDKVAIGSLEFEVVIGKAAEAATPEADVLETGAVIESDTSMQEQAVTDTSQTMVDIPVQEANDPPPTEHSDTQVLSNVDTQVPGAPPTAPPPPAAAPPMQQPAAPPLQYAPGVYPPPGYPYPPNQYYPPQGYPQPGYPPQGYPQPPYGGGGYPQQPMPPGYPQQPPQGTPAQQPVVPVESHPIEEPAQEGEKQQDSIGIRLPDPSETGAKEPEPKKSSGSTSGGGEAASDPRSAATDIIRQMQQRRPKSDS